MSTLFPFIPHVDSGSKSAGLIDTNDLGEAHQDARGFVRFKALGTEIGKSDAIAKPKIQAALMRAWNGQAVQAHLDGATDFLISGLELVGGAAENLVRPSDPTLFVPGPGLTLALKPRNVLKPGYRTNSFKIRQRSAQAVWTEPHAVSELPRASYQDEKEVRGAEYYGIQYGYTIPETWEAEILGDDVLSENQMAAVEGLDDFRERVAMWGSADKNLEGFATLSGAVMIGGGQQFSSLTPTAIQMMQRLAAFEQRYMLANQGRRPTHLLAPYADKIALQTVFFPNTSNSAWSAAVEMYPWIANAIWDDRLLLANEGGTAARWILYTQDDRNLYYEHMETMLFGPFQHFMTFTFVALRRHGGAINKIPERVAYVDFTA